MGSSDHEPDARTEFAPQSRTQGRLQGRGQHGRSTEDEERTLHQDYQRLLESGTKPNLAKLTLARKLAATALAMWKKEEVYSPDKHRMPKLTPG